jgi:uncharacterized membrane protein YvbJ
MMKCPNCGKEANYKKRFCGHCGVPINQEESVTVKTPIAERSPKKNEPLIVKEDRSPKVSAGKATEAETSESPEWRAILIVVGIFLVIMLVFASF